MGARDKLRQQLSQHWVFKKKSACESCGQPDATRRVYDEDGYLLRVQKNKVNYLTIHHIDGNIENNTDENLQTLCRLCHEALHNLR